MSELKATTAYDAYWKATSNGDNSILVYLKSEADKEIQRLENLCESYRIDCDNLAISEANAYKDIGRCNKRIRHQKFMRCNLLIDYCGLKQNTCEEEKVPFWRKWYLRWCELSDKFKEEK